LIKSECLSARRYQQRVLINKRCGKRTSNALYIGVRQSHILVCAMKVCVCVCVCVCVFVCVCVCVCFLLLSFKLSSGCLFSPHHVNQGGVQKSTPQVTFTRPTLVECLSGDAELASTARYCLAMVAKRGNSSSYLGARS